MSMDTQIYSLLESSLDFVNKSFLSDYMYIIIFKFGKSFWVLVSTLISNLFELIIKHLIRSKDDGDCTNNLDANNFCQDHDEQILNQGSTDLNSNGYCEKENSEFYFGFKFQLGDGFKMIEETKSSVLMETELNMSTSKYTFESVQDIGVFMECPKTGSFVVQEIFAGSNEGFIDDQQNLDSGIVIDKDFLEPEIQEDFIELQEGAEFHSKGKVGILEEVEEKSEDSISSEEEEGLNLGDNEVSKKEPVNWLADNFLNSENFPYGLRFLSESEFDPSDSKLESDDSGYGFSISQGEADSGDLDFFRDDDGNEKIESKIDDLVEEMDENLQPNKEDSSDLLNSNPILEDEELKKPKEKSWDFDLDDEEDALLEHQHLVEQMKMEMKNSRSNGLPTIFEECETMKMADDIKPWKIDEKNEHGDRMEVIQKFYKSYAERMRKLDVLNYQTSQAIGFLHMKNPVHLNSSDHNSPLSAIKTRLLPNIWCGKSRRIFADPTLKSIGELQRDLEVVYVGQVCLSWEILRWQHGKAKEFQEYDSEGFRSYNQVAGEFQQFHVLVQRFTEDEAFQGPRLQNYVKKREILRTLLQVPTIKDDVKDRKGKRQDEEYVISMAMLAELIEESMRVFWSFLRADKDCANLISKTHHASHASLQDSADLELLTNIKTSLQKKEKRHKDIVRTGNCLVKKFQKHQTARLDLQLFITQVELRLVSRVLSLQRLSHDQLIWCMTKLNNVNFVDRTKIHIEPLFLLFPC